MNRIAVFARPPRPGEVKRRLAPALPDALAARLYAALLQDTLDAARACAADERVLCWSELPSPEAPGAPARAGFTEYAQVPGGLGERLAACFEQMLAGPGDRAAIAGSDCPAITPGYFDAAFAALESHDVAIAPAADGGYGLIALARPAPGLFRGIPWSTPEVRARTLAAATAAGLRVATLSPLDDLDTPADLARLVARHVASDDPAACGPHAREALRGMGLLP